MLGGRARPGKAVGAGRSLPAPGGSAVSPPGGTAPSSQRPRERPGWKLPSPREGMGWALAAEPGGFSGPREGGFFPGVRAPSFRPLLSAVWGLCAPRVYSRAGSRVLTPVGRQLSLRLNLLSTTNSKTVFFLQSAGGEAMNENKFLNTDSSTGSVETTVKPLPFKDPNFIHSGIGGAAAGKKNRTWKNLKQILASERALPWQLNDPSYFNIDAPPSFKPAKKYSDISGLPANYTDPQSKLRFSTIEEFAYIRMLPSDVVTGYLALRKATSIVS
ncbi:PREDICTED: INO80 complex subunit C [Calidris pugnax]|nr:PREDICTED: INO80 complex subunit C [Calidris pugnax]